MLTVLPAHIIGNSNQKYKDGNGGFESPAGSKIKYMNYNYDYSELLQVAEMYRDQMKGHPSEGSIAYIMADNAIKNYYKGHPCPHRIADIKPITTGGGCETTVTVCHDCGTILSQEKTDC